MNSIAKGSVNMKETRVACCQFEPIPGDVKANRKKIESLLDSSRRLTPHVVVFPEVCIQGISPAETIANTAEGIPGDSSKLICALSKEYDVYCVVGLAEKRGGAYFNAALLTSPEGKIRGIYRKTHLWTNERQVYTKGTEYPVFDTDVGRVGMWICYDTRFPEVARSLSMKGASIAFVPTAWLRDDVEHWRLAMRSRALDNFLYVCGSDQIAQSSFHQACGASLICDPNGQIISEATEMKEMAISATIDLTLVSRLRASIPVLEDMKIEVLGTDSRGPAR
jgi:predicted amidohydrolase